MDLTGTRYTRMSLVLNGHNNETVGSLKGLRMLSAYQ